MNIRATDINRVTRRLNQFGRSLSVQAQQSLNVFGFKLLALAQTRSPVDSGRFRAAWQLFPSYRSPGSIAAIMLTNNLRYAGVIEYGSALGSRPWKSPGPKTTAVNGRVYSLQAPGGVITPTMPNIARQAAEAVLRGIRA